MLLKRITLQNKTTANFVLKLIKRNITTHRKKTPKETLTMNITNALLALLLTTSITNTILSAKDTSKDTTTQKTVAPIQCTVINPDKAFEEKDRQKSRQLFIDYYTKSLNDLSLTRDRIVYTYTLLGGALICYR